MTVKGMVKLATCTVLALVVQAVDGSLRADLNLKWPAPFLTQGTIKSSPAIGADGTIYIGNDSGVLFAITPSGAQKWPYYSAVGAIESTPAIGADGTVYFGTLPTASNQGFLYAVDGTYGTPRWAVPFATGGGIYSSPAIGADGTIYVGSEDGSLYAINPDETKKWSFATGDGIDSSPAIGADGTIYIGSYDHNLYAINPDGSLKWSFPTDDRIVAAPAIGADGTIYVGSMDGHLYALTPGGNSKWTVTTGGAVETSPAIGPNGFIYFASLDGLVYAVEPDGTVRWQKPPIASSADNLYSSPAVRADGTIILGAGTNVVAMASDGSVLKTVSTGGYVDSSPVIGADGTIYVGSYDKRLYAYDGNGRGPAASAWPLFRHDLARGGRVPSSTVSQTDPGRLVNMSVLDPLSAVNPTLTLGLVTGGKNTSGAQDVLVRGIGPSLSEFGLAPVVTNPHLTMFQGSSVFASNDDWADTAAHQSAVTAADAAVYAFPLTNPLSLDSALVAVLPVAGGYSVQVTGGNPGYALAEVYDATPLGGYTSITPRLINLSCLANLSPGGFLTAGFIIGGSTPETVMIRATGPALVNLGNPTLTSSTVLPDPLVSLHTSVNGVDSELASDQGWGAFQQNVSSIIYDSKSVGAFPLADTTSQDSALLMTLAPGAYTAQVQSASGAGGATLVEVYEIP